MITAYLGLGSNMGDRLKNIQHALALLGSVGTVTTCSPLYESEAMYLADQQDFLNAVCELQTSLTPAELLPKIHTIEHALGRARTIQNGPRPIDIDILLYGEHIVNESHLTIPHTLMHERKFVLAPLFDLAPHLIHPVTRKTIRSLLQDVMSQNCSKKSSIIRAPAGSAKFTWSTQTYVMGILNCTPDSFSGDGDTLISSAVAHAHSMIADGAHIIDIGGESTRPGHTAVSAEEEISRVIPVIERLVQDKISVPISIDTSKSTVADAAIRAGATIVNDVWGLKKDPLMAEVIARHNVLAILMHNELTSGAPEVAGIDIIERVKYGLRVSLEIADASHISRERIILDAGFGFVKNIAENIELVRRHAELTALGYPLLVGTSRKSFIGHTLNLEAGERLEGTLATCTLLAERRADIVRVHDVKEVVRSVKMTDAIVRITSI